MGTLSTDIVPVSWIRRAAALVTAMGAVAAIVFLAPRDASIPIEGRRSEAARLMSELMSGTASVGGPFTLQDSSGKRVSLADYRGKVVLLYFGYMFCPNVCPADLAAIGQCMRLLGTAGEVVQPLFVTLDPERDRGEALRGYAASFHPRFIALTGSSAEVEQVARSYKVFHEKIRPPGVSSYLIDHTAFVFLLDREGRFAAIFPPGTPPQRMETLVREQIARAVSS